MNGDIQGLHAAEAFARTGLDGPSLYILFVVAVKPLCTTEDIRCETEIHERQIYRKTLELRQRRLIHRTEDQTDSRVFRLTLTPDGRALCRTILTALKEPTNPESNRATKRKR